MIYLHFPKNILQFILTLFENTASLSSDHMLVIDACYGHVLTSCVDVKVGGFVGHVACSVQTWSPGMYFAGVAQILRYIHCVWTLVNVLTGKQHFHLKRQRQDKVKTLLFKVI